ncbi:MAG: cell envelope integrity protein TolA [Desulfurivibrionaceae bacterium]
MEGYSHGPLPENPAAPYRGLPSRSPGDLDYHPFYHECRTSEITGSIHSQSLQGPGRSSSAAAGPRSGQGYRSGAQEGGSHPGPREGCSGHETRRNRACAPPPVPREKISLSPIRQRLEEERKEKEKEKEKEARKRSEEQRRNELEQLRLGYLEERAEKEMAKAESVAEQAEQAAVEAKKAALARIAEGYRSSDQSRRNRPESTGTGTDKGGPNQQELEALDRYGARLRRHISPHWQLPELQEWDEDLRAVIVIQVNRDGTVTGTYFEKRSRDSRFNRYVQKAVDNAQPLPPFPIDFHKKSEEIGVTFSPGGLF